MEHLVYTNKLGNLVNSVDTCGSQGLFLYVLGIQRLTHDLGVISAFICECFYWGHLHDNTCTLLMIKVMIDILYSTTFPLSRNYTTWNYSNIYCLGRVQKHAFYKLVSAYNVWYILVIGQTKCWSKHICIDCQLVDLFCLCATLRALSMESPNVSLPQSPVLTMALTPLHFLNF